MLRILISVIGAAILGSCNFNTEKNQPTSADNIKELPVDNYVQIATGQVNLYNTDGELITEVYPNESFFGQDANYLKGKKMSFHNNGNGTITDLNTGLMWQAVPSNDGFNWNDAVSYCEDLNLAGYTDWRTPSLKELFSISDFSSGWPYLNIDYFSIINEESIDKSEQYWSSNKYVGTTQVGGNNAAFGVNHATGHIKAYPAAAPEKGSRKDPPPPPPPGQERSLRNGIKPRGNPLLKYVRAVRGNTYGINDFQENRDGTISDHATGLMWAKNDSAEGLDWQNALSFAEASKLAGYTDWRLPNVKEMQGIVDYSYAPNASEISLIRPAIDPIFNCTAITNENGEDDYGYYWTSTSARFQKGQPYYYAWYVAFGRAVNAEGKDFHGAGAVRFDTKTKDGPLGEGGERYFNYVRVVRDID